MSKFRLIMVWNCKPTGKELEKIKEKLKEDFEAGAGIKMSNL
jgi:hypothetical protein